MDLVRLLLLDLRSGTVYLNICVILNFQQTFSAPAKRYSGLPSTENDTLAHYRLLCLCAL